jgi:hypothetical protein
MTTIQALRMALAVECDYNSDNYDDNRVIYTVERVLTPSDKQRVLHLAHLYTSTYRPQLIVGV